MKRSFEVVARRDGTVGGMRGIAYLCYTGEEILSVIEEHSASTISFIGRMATAPVDHYELVDGVFKIETDKGTRSINLHQIVVFVSERGDCIILLPIMKFLLMTGIDAYLISPRAILNRLLNKVKGVIVLMVLQ